MRSETALASPTSPAVSSGPPIKPGSVRAWILAGRPKTLSAALTPVLVGSACALAAGKFNGLAALTALLGALLLQIGSNLANDLFDFQKGADTAERLGPLRAAQAGLLTPRQLRRGMTAAFLFAVLAGAHLVFIAGPVIVLIGLCAIASAIAYTGGPYPLGYHGLGDLFVMIFFGFVAVCGTAFVQVGSVPALAWFAAIPIGALATCILVVNNVRDLATDAKSGKRTIPVRFGRKVGIAEYGALVMLAHAVPVGLWLAGAATHWVLLPLLTFPVSIRLFQALRNLTGSDLNPVLAKTAQTLLAFGVLFAVGIANP